MMMLLMSDFLELGTLADMHLPWQLISLRQTQSQLLACGSLNAQQEH